MKQKQKNKIKLIIVLVLLLITTGCTTTLTDKNKKPVRNEVTGQNLTKNIICQPTTKETIKLYKENGVKVDKLPKCENFKITSGKYEGLWTSLFVKPLAFVLIFFGKNVGNYAVSLIILTLIIRLLAYPVTKKTALQSELIKKAQPELDRLKNKYKNKTDQESMMKQQQEMMMIYKKHNINPLSGCLFSFLQLPLFIAFFEAVQRTPAIFEDKFLTLQLGTTPSVGIFTSHWLAYAIIILLIGGSTYYSLRMNSTANMTDPTMKMMPTMMTVMLVLTGIFMPSGLGIYWVTSNIFTIVQNIIVKRSKEVNGKA
ncbi:MAG: YidC/Oxa1 family membrane protein insertase [Bacilli bacterium]|nr:YidC/Oxa1 family membrane protein insertase [Mycoplasmatota bacterium]MDD6941206.1 YidC/Oxa1 family membrane protein insertase [bacterium]MDY2697227.1 YidC/Oxa1 family membrane protein insertase [Bacilli bacterium]MDY5992895.1 YidC/Oxa1 family membrane protein insertase [Bacilli bacterium]MEE0014701.1 YidC/Oxa1 family membrane protein insertase [Bacilli bacterium]